MVKFCIHLVMELQAPIASPLLFHKYPGDTEKPGDPQQQGRLKETAKVGAAQLAANCHVKVSFAKVSGAKGYDIYRSAKSSSGYKKIKTVTKNSFTDKSVKALR